MFSHSFRFFISFFKNWLNQLFSISFHKSLFKLKKYRNIKKGKKVIIICNGPSLNDVNWEVIKKSNIDTIGLNKINLIFTKTDFRPTYIVCINRYVVEQNKTFFNNTEIPLFIDYNNKDILRGEKINYIYSLPLRGFFSKDISKGYCQGFTVTYAAMQLAYHMGYDEVGLIGCDHYFKDKGIPNTTIKTVDIDRNHFDPNYFGKGMEWQLPDILGSEFHYQISRDFFQKNNKKIYNCTNGGHLEIFERKSLSNFID